MPMPIPAPKSMANHEKRENSGSSSGRPIFNRPKRGIKASTIADSIIAATR